LDGISTSAEAAAGASAASVDSSVVVDRTTRRGAATDRLLGKGVVKAEADAIRATKRITIFIMVESLSWFGETTTVVDNRSRWRLLRSPLSRWLQDGSM
jgi:hypothetical protein